MADTMTDTSRPNVKRKTEAESGERRAKKAKRTQSKADRRACSQPDDHILQAYPARSILMFKSDSRDT